jgi:hypothetical protein
LMQISNALQHNHSQHLYVSLDMLLKPQLLLLV